MLAVLQSAPPVLRSARASAWGLLLTIAPHVHLPDIHDRMRAPGLRWRWIICYYEPQATQHVHAAKVSPKWKPILAYLRDGGGPEKYASDFIDSGPFDRRDKAAHEWGQSPGGSVH